MMYTVIMKQKILLAFFLCIATFGFPAGKPESLKQNETPVTGGQQDKTTVFAENSEPEKNFPVLTKEGVYPCGKQPKQVVFTPDGKFIVLPLLDEDGFDIFDTGSKKIIKRINPPNSSQKGFVEGIFIPEKSSFFISQMTTNNIYEYSYPGFEFRREIPTGGVWSKFIAWNKEQNYIAVSNWVSNDISLIDYDTGELLALIKTEKAPRGIIFTEDGKSLISLSFEGGAIQKFSITEPLPEEAAQTGKKLAVTEDKRIFVNNAAMRHIVVNKTETKAWISDMYHFKIYEIDLSDFTISKELKVFHNPNTIELLRDRFLFVSSRGPNNPEDYTLRSPQNGKITVIDTEDFSVYGIFEGGNQPTGLDISPGGNLLCFSDFQDAALELYRIDYRETPPAKN